MSVGGINKQIKMTTPNIKRLPLSICSPEDVISFVISGGEAYEGLEFQDMCKRIQSKQARQAQIDKEAEAKYKRESKLTLARECKSTKNKKEETGDKGCMSDTVDDDEGDEDMAGGDDMKDGGESAVMCDDSEQFDWTPASKAFLIDISNNLKRKKNARLYSQETLDLSWLIFLTSPKTYNIMRQLLPLPCKANLYQRFSKDLKTVKEELTSIDALARHVRQYHEESAKNYRGKEPKDAIPITLAVDAFSFKSFQGMVPGRMNDGVPKAETFSNGFVMLVSPLSARLKNSVVHIKKHKDGAHNRQVRSQVWHVINNLEDNGFRVWFKATDGDMGVQQEHNDFHREWISGESPNFQEIVRRVSEWLKSGRGRHVPIGDPLHIFKNIRARLLNHKIVLTPWSEEKDVIDVKQIEGELNLKEVLNDNSQIGKMRDIYTVRLFTFHNFIKLVKAGMYNAAMLFLPYCCWMAVIFSVSLSNSQRSWLIELSFYLFNCFLNLEEDMPNVKHRGKDQIVTFTEPNYVRRILNSLVAFGVCLYYGDDDLRFDSLGTHLVENAIGIARQDSNDPRWDRIWTAFAHAEMRKRIAKQYRIILYVPGRINDGGAKKEEEDDRTVEWEAPKEWAPDRIIHALLDCTMITKTTTDSMDFIDTFCREIAIQFGDIDVHEYNVNETANCSIMARLIKFNGKTEETK